MNRLLLLTTIGFLYFGTLLNGQNVFNPFDPIVRYNAASVLGSAERPDPSKQGLQKWVSTATIGVSSGSGSFDASSYKAYFINHNGSQMPFRVKFPRSYNNPDSAGKKYPMMMFFHGAGEAGCPSNNGLYNNEKQLLLGGDLFRSRVDNNQFDGFLIYPQALAGAGCWSDWGIAPYSPYYQLFINVVDSLAKYARADADRLFVNGLSNGAKPAFSFTTVYRQRVAAAAPSAAATSDNNYPDFVHIPIWFASGGTDNNPTPGFAQATYTGIKNAGGNIVWTLFEGKGHAIWWDHWLMPGYTDFMQAHHKANPHVYFQRNLFCPDSAINAKIGISPGYFAYEWQKDGASYPATGNEIVVNTYGTYRVRFKRSASSEWSPWSPRPAVIGQKGATQTPSISITGIRSKVLPAPDGSKTVPLELPASFLSYQWVRANDNIVVSTQRTFNAPVGEYKAKTVEQFGCGSLFSPVFKVVDANGSPKPEPAKNLTALAQNQTSIRLDWSENPNPGTNETGFEIYRSNKPGGPYQLIDITPANVSTYLNTGLPSNQKYYYIVRAVNNTGAAALSNEASATSMVDNKPPTAPQNLLYRGSSQSSVNLAWTAATDDVAVDKYDVFVNGVKMYTTSNTSVTVAGLKPDQLYTFTVKARDAAGNLSAPSNQESGYTHNQGINYKYYHGTWTSLPDFATLTPVKTGVMDNVTNGLGIRTQIDNFAFLWEGYIFIPVTGSYTFETDSDDGSKLYIDQNYSHTATALVNNDGIHGPQFRTGTITLSRGYHRFVATFFEASGGEVMDVWWSGPGVTREKLPKNYLSTNTFTLGAVPAAPTGLTGNTPQFNRVNLSWTHGGLSTTGYEILRSTSPTGTFVPAGTVPVAEKSFVDTTVNASTAYSYRARAINNNGTSDFSNTFTITTAAAPAAPTAPTSLSALLVGKTSVQLTWSDNSSNETSFELERSVSNNANFRLLKIVPGGAGTQKTFTDTGLFANVTYFYRVRAVGSSNSSVYSNQVTARTLNTKPEFVNPKDFTMKIRTTYTLPVVVNDIDGDPLTFTITGLPAFGSMQTVSNGKVNLVFNASLSSAGSYPMIMYVNDGNNGRDTAYFTMVVNQNSVPTMTQLSNVSMNEGESRTLSLVANDAEGNSSIFWTFTDKPSFVTFTNNGNGRGSLQVNPGYSNAGIYNMTIFADDGYGAWTSSNFSIEVKEKDPNETVQVNVRYYTDPVPKWNGVDVRPELPKPFTLSNLKNNKDSLTTIGITALSSDYEGGSEGAQSPSNTGVFPNNVMKNQIRWGFFAGGNHRDLLTLRVTGLNVNKKYNFIFFASSTCTGCQLTAASTTTYKIGSQSAVVNYFNNISQTDTIYQVQPNGSGEILIDMIGDPNTTSGGVLNALVIEAQYDDGSTPVKPVDLTGTFVDNSGVQLSWTDQSYNENAFQVYRSTTRNGSYTLVNPGINNKDSVSFTDVTTSPFTQYYYYVAGANNAGIGVSSDTVSVLTGNNKPRIIGLGNMYVKTGGTVSDDFTVTDDAGDVVTVSIVNRPGYITLSSLGGNNYRITATPTIDNIDWHKVTISAQDNKGGVTTQDIVLTVSESGIRSVYVNLGNFGKVAPEPWNNKIGYAEAGSQITALKDDANTPTPFAVQFVNKWEGLTDIGHITGNETGVYPDAVLQSGVWDSSGTARTILFSGLDPAKRYNLVFVGSQNEGIDATTVFTASGQTSTINARYNTNKTANLNNLTPNSSGQITVNVTRGSANKMYLNGLHIEEFVPTSTTMNPMNLYLEPRDRTSVILTWSDRSSNETGFTLQRATDSLFSANVVTLNYAANLTSTSITGLTPNTKYWFRVRPSNNSTGWSNRISTITPEQVVSVNFNFTVENAPWPWNNTQTQPNLPESFNNLIDHAGQNSGISMKIEKIFNGEFNAGMNTGNNSGIVPDNVLRGNYWLDNGQQSTIRVSGLNQTKRYRFGFIGSSSPDGWFAGDYTATYTINGRTVYLNSWRNTTEIAYMGNVLADSNGEVLITFSTTAAALYAFNAGVIIQAYDDPSGGTVLNGEILPPSEVTLPPATVPAGEIAVVENVSDWKVNMYPNPFADHLNIDFHNSNASNNLSVEVLDLTGKLIHRRVYGKVSQGYITLRMNASEGNIGTGVYLVVLKVNGKSVSSGKLVRTRQ